MKEKMSDKPGKVHPLVGCHALENGRTYRISDTGQPYVKGEYPSGGFHIEALLSSGAWSYIDNSPDLECVENFLRGVALLPPNATGEPEGASNGQ